MVGVTQTFFGVIARVRSAGLDRVIADGVDPNGDRLLAARAEQLMSRQSRDSLIAVLRADLDEAIWFCSQDELDPRRRQRELFKARAELQRLIDCLTGEKEISAQGIARLRRLVTDHLGPMYGHGPPGTLERTLRTAIEQLEA